MSVAKLLLSNLLSSAVIVVALSGAVSADPMPITPKPLNNVEALVPATVPTLVPAASAAIDDTGASPDLSRADISAYKPDLDEMAQLQRQNKILRLKAEAASLKKEIATAEGRGDQAGAALSPGFSAQVIKASAVAAPSWSVSSIQGSGASLTAVIDDGRGSEIEARAGKSISGLGRIVSVRPEGVAVSGAGGSKFIPFMAGQ